MHVRVLEEFAALQPLGKLLFIDEMVVSPSVSPGRGARVVQETE
jgi:hypothetical protein